MVTIINFKERQKEDGTSFYLLEIQGGIEMVKSQTTGQYYATSQKAYIPSTFNETTCKALIGTQMKGNIQKVECEPYEYTIRETGEVIMLNHRFVYSQQEQGPVVVESNTDFKSYAETETFSRNGRSVEFA
ncbi:hypothetical protein [Chryseobacterium fistulae]|uniref:Uncharacterized protein n=1 Tax=Chryseobacterium fistulae TaxID=2675058 RepID=A0A6N4XP34_9FLAO|nr:hypothetical protein [Chryseobacterium fistulae]CAA7386953.1 hypothetical protein CHRY9393_01254 [Chryseobacterium fistulae]